MPFFSKDSDNASALSGGVTIIVDKAVACQQLNLCTSLEAVTVQAVLFIKLVTIGSIYIPLVINFVRQFQSFTDELPAPYIVVGGVNAYNSLWGDSRCNVRESSGAYI